MPTNIFNYDGSLLTVVQDGAIATEVASLKFPGRGYKNYGEAISEDMLWLLQNFANAAAPLTPVIGQIWFDTNAAILKVFTAAGWVAAGGVIASATAPLTGSNIGAFWYDTTNKQLNVWNGAAWNLVGPLGSATNTDPLNPVTAGFSAIDSVRITDSTGGIHQVWRFNIGASSNSLLAIFSNDPTFTPLTPITGFATIHPGINLNTAITGIGITGDATIFRSGQDNLPDVTNLRNLGSVSLEFANVYATNFVGSSSSAKYADLAERYATDEPLSSGTVVCIGGSKEITSSRNLGDDMIFGVVSTNPAYLMNQDAGNDNTHPAVALTGRVPCKVTGQVFKGQRLMASAIPGVACAWDSTFSFLSILGRTLESKTTTGIDTIEVVLGKQ